MHFTHKAGDKLFIDFTGKKLSIVDPGTGELQDLEVFVCVLGSSQYTYVEACASQKKKILLDVLKMPYGFMKVFQMH